MREMLENGKSKIRYAKCVSSSNNFITFVTGSKAYVMDKNYYILQYYEKLDHVYYIEISPDEKHLLLGSTSNHFYIIEILTRTVKKVTSKKPYDGNLEMMVRFSIDSQNIYAVCLNTKTMLSCLRKYSVNDPSDYFDYLSELYCFFALDIIYEKDQTVLLSGYDRKKDQYHIVWFENGKVRDYRLPLFYEDISTAIYYLPIEHIVIIPGQASIFFCNEYGEAYAEIGACGLEYYDEDGSCGIGDTFYKCLQDIQGKLGCLNERLRYSFSFSLILPYERTRIYICGQHGIYAYDFNCKTLFRIFNEGVKCEYITELEQNMIALTTWNGSVLVKGPQKIPKLLQ